MEVANQQTGELVTYEPVTPVELEFLIRTIGERLEDAVPVIKSLWETRYRTERELIQARAEAMLASTLSTVTERRAAADLASMDHRARHDEAKEVLHAAEELQKALTARLYGLQNINKVLASAYNSGGSR